MKKILGSTLGNCVHVAGMMNFFNLAEDAGYETEFIGIGASIGELIGKVVESDPDYVAVSFRLTPESLRPVLEELKNALEEADPMVKEKHWIFGGTMANALIAEEYDIFQKIFNSSEDIDDTLAYLRGSKEGKEESYPRNLVDRIESKYPYPILRHHLGLSTIEETVDAIEEIAEAKVLDVISVALDQNAQEFFFDQENMDTELDGAGGVPIRTEDGFRRLFDGAQRGNYPLLRSYSGTKNMIPLADVLDRTIENAWCAVPVFWYSELDGRSKRKLEDAIGENQELMKWHAERDIPVESNDPHHWGLRDSHDAISVADAYIVAYNAKQMGVKSYISQFMFNVPANMSPVKDLAKMLAMIELMEELEDDNFKIYRQARAGLASFPTDIDQAKGQLAASAALALNIKPHIYHVVAYSEAQYAAGAKEVIESCKIVRGVIRNHFLGTVEISEDPEVLKRKEELVKEARLILEAIKSVAGDSENPLSDPKVLARAVELGILDAPHLKGNSIAKGELKTRMVDGALYAYDSKEKRIISEKERLERILGKL